MPFNLDETEEVVNVEQQEEEHNEVLQSGQNDDVDAFMEAHEPEKAIPTEAVPQVEETPVVETIQHELVVPEVVEEE